MKATSLISEKGPSAWGKMDSRVIKTESCSISTPVSGFLTLRQQDQRGKKIGEEARYSGRSVGKKSQSAVVIMISLIMAVTVAREHTLPLNSSQDGKTE